MQYIIDKILYLAANVGICGIIVNVFNDLMFITSMVHH